MELINNCAVVLSYGLPIIVLVVAIVCFLVDQNEVDPDSLNGKYSQNMEQIDHQNIEKKNQAKIKAAQKAAEDSARWKKKRAEAQATARLRDDRRKVTTKLIDEWFDHFCTQLIQNNIFEDKLKQIEKKIASGDTSDTYRLFYGGSDEYPLPIGVTSVELIDVIRYKNYSKKINRKGHKLNGCTVLIEFGPDPGNFFIMFSNKFYSDYASVYINLKLQRK